MGISTSNISSTSRFSNRAENYARFRPGYPDEIFDFLEKEMQLKTSDCIVDIGSGTGLFAEPLLKHGLHVVCIEPNEEMRKAGEARLRKYPAFESMQSTAEHTGLTENSVDLITVAQTFHWIDPIAARLECKRVLKPHGQVVLAWNRQRNESTFEKQYTDLRNRYRMGAPGPIQIDPVLINEFFAPTPVATKIFSNKQLLDFEALKGQLLSKSYSPLPGHDTYDDMITDLIKLFVAYNQQGQVEIEYETLLFWGKLD